MKQAAQRFFARLGLQVSRIRSQPTLGIETFEQAGPDIVDLSKCEPLWYDYRQHPVNRTPGRVWNESSSFANSLKGIDLRRFRSDNAYVWQTRGSSLGAFIVSALWAEKNDSFGLLNSTEELGDYGVECIRLQGRLWSRDLVDSVLEITFLMESLPPGSLDTMTTVDIGAGYGRLLRRLADVTHNDNLFGVDGVALSTCIAEAYISHLKLRSRVRILTLAEADELSKPVHLVTNVHSFSEMPLDAVCWWLDWARDRGTEFLFIVPNVPGPALNDGTDLMPHIRERGFVLAAHRMKYTDELIGTHALYQAHYYLFTREAESQEPRS